MSGFQNLHMRGQIAADKKKKKSRLTFTLLEYRTRRSTLKSSASLPSKRENWFSVKAHTATRPASSNSPSCWRSAHVLTSGKRKARTLSGVICANSAFKSLSKFLFLSQISQCKVEWDESNGVGLNGPVTGLAGGDSTTGFCRDRPATL